MAIKFKNGNVVTAGKNGEVDVIAHVCNCFNTMGSGVALEIAKNIPEAKGVDQLTRKGDKSKLGTFTKTGFGGGVAPNQVPVVYNLYGQYNYGRPTRHKVVYLDYEFLESALSAMAEDIRKVNFILAKQGLPEERIGMPRIGSNRAGGDWNLILEIINKTCGDLDVTIYSLKQKS